MSRRERASTGWRNRLGNVEYLWHFPFDPGRQAIRVRAAGRREPRAAQDAAPHHGGGDAHGPDHDGRWKVQVGDRQVAYGGAGVGQGRRRVPA